MATFYTLREWEAQCAPALARRYTTAELRKIDTLCQLVAERYTATQPADTAAAITVRLCETGQRAWSRFFGIFDSSTGRRIDSYRMYYRVFSQWMMHGQPPRISPAAFIGFWSGVSD